MSPHSVTNNHGQRIDTRKNRIDKVIVIVTSATPPGLTESGPPVGLDLAVLGKQASPKSQGLTVPGSQRDPPKYENEK